MQGIGPLIAGSPTTHDAMPLGQPLDVQHYQQSPALWGGGMSMDGCMDPQPPPFQQLVSERVEQLLVGSCAFVSGRRMTAREVPGRRRHAGCRKSSKINSRASGRFEWATTGGAEGGGALGVSAWGAPGSSSSYTAQRVKGAHATTNTRSNMTSDTTARFRCTDSGTVWRWDTAARTWAATWCPPPVTLLRRLSARRPASTSTPSRLR